MKAIYLTAIATVLWTGGAFGSDVFVAPNVTHHSTNSQLERHAEAFTFDGVRCTARFFATKDAEGDRVARKSVNCQE